MPDSQAAASAGASDDLRELERELMRLFEQHKASKVARRQRAASSQEDWSPMILQLERAMSVLEYIDNAWSFVTEGVVTRDWFCRYRDQLQHQVLLDAFASESAHSTAGVPREEARQRLTPPPRRPRKRGSAEHPD